MTDSSGLKIHVSGIVQGVGFRPFVYNLATTLDLKGWVVNTSSGVDIEISGSSQAIEQFVTRLKQEPPLLAHIDGMDIQQIPPSTLSKFSIRESIPLSGEYIPISPDVTICPDCRRELFDPSNRRFRYPFINCTNCGPRFTIIKDIPYDRPLTTMSGFEMCPSCRDEYQDPSDRRFHAQPTACPDCGPTIHFASRLSRSKGEDALQQARSLLAQGKILAVKGLGGYHLACDAMNSDAVERLRDRKKRSDKPFALMSFNIEGIARFVHVSEEEQKLLDSPQHPVVLLKKRTGNTLLDATAPHQNHLGFMLPYTPLHLLLLESAPGYPEVLVMTSGNISEEPIAYEDEDAADRLSSIADGFLTHDRPIHMRVDDSVTRVFEKKVFLIRRARGYAPQPLSFPKELPEILACGAELKNTFSLSRGRHIFISHHIGDLENYETLKSFEEGIEHYKRLFRLSPRSIAVDLHPDYLSTKYGFSQSALLNLPLLKIQHHHAHLAACLADNNYVSEKPVIGLIFDGTGYGTDGNIWGGEVLLGGYRAFDRRFHLAEVPLPGGDSAIRNPSRITLAHLHAAQIEWEANLPPVQSLCAEERTVLRSQISHRINTPLTTSMGRLFDAVSSLLGIRHKVSYEGQAAIELENLCDPREESAYEVPVAGDIIDDFALFPQILLDYRKGISNAVISARFHNSIAQVCLNVCNEIRKETSLNVVALSGGVWQNMTLLKKTLSGLRQSGFEVLIHRNLPTNDGGISAGQLLIAASQN